MSANANSICQHVKSIRTKGQIESQYSRFKQRVGTTRRLLCMELQVFCADTGRTKRSSSLNALCRVEVTLECATLAIRAFDEK
jgi:hypothetical protein